jgi:hypothetical protein
MNQNTYGGAHNLSGNKEIPSTLRNPKAYYYIHYTPQLVAFLSYFNPLNINPIL